jgi:hypothetical protein
MISRRDVLKLAAATAAAGVLPARALAQETTRGTWETLAEFPLDALPGPADPGVEGWFLRFTGAPGASVPLTADIGPSILYVESGAVTMRYEGTVRVRRAGADAEEEVPTAAAGAPLEVALAPGDAMLTVKGNRSGGANTAEGDASVLQWLVMSPIDEVAAMEEEMDEPAIPFLPHMIAVGSASLPEGPGVIALDRQIFVAGESQRSDEHQAFECGGVEAGGLSMTIVAGEMFHWPGIMAFDPAAAEAAGMATMEAGGTPEATGPDIDRFAAGDMVDLATDDGYAFGPGTTLDWTVGPAGATLLRGVIYAAG